MIHVLNSIAKTLIDNGYSQIPFYVQQVPQDFERPSFFIQYVMGDSEEIGRGNYIENMTFQIVYFSHVNEYDYTDTVEQLKEMERIKRPFKKGYIVLDKIGRTAKVQGLRAEVRDGEIYIDIDLYIYNYESPELPQIPEEDSQFELMKELVFSTRVN